MCDRACGIASTPAPMTATSKKQIALRVIGREVLVLTKFTTLLAHPAFPTGPWSFAPRGRDLRA